MVCPKCESNKCWRDEVDIGVGTIYGPWRCDGCGWYQEDEMNALRATSEVQNANKLEER